MRSLRAVVMCLALAMGPAAHATSMVQVDVVEQALDSTAVVFAEVVSADPSVTPQRSYVDTQVRVLSLLTGEAPSVLNIRQVGGTHGGRTVFVPGDGRLIPGERVVAFIRRVDGRWYLTAMAQSVWHVEGTGRDAQVHRDFDGVAFYERGPDGSVQTPSQSLPEYATYGELVDAVRDLTMGQP